MKEWALGYFAERLPGLGSSSLVQASAQSEMAGSKAGKDSGNAKTKVVSCSKQASLQKSRTTSQGHVSAPAVVYSLVILENFTAELLELAGNASNNLNIKHITPCHLQLAIRVDE
jgi:histone H2A